MELVIYILAGVSIFLAIGGFNAWKLSGHPGLLISSVVSIGFSGAAIFLIEWWPLVAGFAINWGLRFIGLDPSYKSDS